MVDTSLCEDEEFNIDLAMAELSKCCSVCKQVDDHTVVAKHHKDKCGTEKHTLVCKCGRIRLRIWQNNQHYCDCEWDLEKRKWEKN